MVPKLELELSEILKIYGSRTRTGTVILNKDYCSKTGTRTLIAN